ncbi:hypothetical protein M409DRAFT_52075 [Zasmidium cellare ATCC 36951]|uniref:N-acetyltransferase domain-containing protein n=1 Tax=Zasmidium cellare ATCC 36951 TaxID=1080233 RepID=A0A6A6CQG7_ZASCE|nr:uncharacterized protein M409DRAFT_52075 [Zasmidium cellare ATCC 36951]KAF2169537.1 hypothetical protein M409DRAFT_52075 [Zasmidium cellare ATCC 36951]
MESAKSILSKKRWERGEFFISTNPDLIPIASLAGMFASKEIYWAQPIPVQAAREMLDNSLTFGIYHVGKADSTATEKTSTSDSTSAGPHDLVGLARCVTDFTTFVYLTDVWVHKDFQQRGLGRWLVKCVGDVIDGMPHLRRSMLFTSDWARSVPFYEEILGMEVIETRRNEGAAIMEKKGPAHPDFSKSSDA